MDKRKQQKKLNELHAMAEELTANAHADNRDFRQRMQSQISGGNDGADTLHNIFLDFGYPLTLKFSHFWNMYRRFGIAKNVVELPVDTGWITPPTVEADDAFTRELDKLIKEQKLWLRIKGLDTRQRVGRYAGMFMRVRDNQQPDQKLEPGSQIAEMIPLYESQLEVIKSDTDAMSDRFGQPVMLQYSQSVEGNRNEEAVNTFNIHYTRIVFAAEGADNGWIYGIPALEPVFNSLMDVRKVIGGGGEGFYKNSSQSIVFGIKDTASALANASKLDDFNAQYDDFSRDRSRRAMWTPGLEAKTLESNLISPEPFFNVALNDVAAGSQIPATILIGQQTGRLASDEDSSAFLATVQSRRLNFMTEMVRSIIDWCIQNQNLPSAEYEVVWDDLLARSDEDKLTNADKMASINEKQFKSGGAQVFQDGEIREAAGFEREDLPEPGGEGIDDDFEEDE